MRAFYDKLSEALYREMPDTSVASDKVMLHIEQFDVAQSYVTAKVENRHGDTVRINIQGGLKGIELPETLFKLRGRPQFAYLMTVINGDTGAGGSNNKILVRKLPVLGVKDWLLIYEDDLLMLAVKDAYDEIDIRIVD